MTDAEGVEMFSDDDHLNRQAFRAIIGFTPERREDAIAALLASPTAIHPLVRTALAAAFKGETPFGSRLVFQGGNQLSKRMKAYEARKRWLKIGRYIQDLRNSGVGLQPAIEAASSKFVAGTKTCEAALTYFRKVDEWISTVRVPGTIYDTYSVQELEDRYIGFESSGEAIPPNMTLEEKAEQERQAEQLLLHILEGSRR